MPNLPATIFTQFTLEVGLIIRGLSVRKLKTLLFASNFQDYLEVLMSFQEFLEIL
jgi:hypothetical protein